MLVLCTYIRRARSSYDHAEVGGIMIDVDDSNDIVPAFYAKLRADLELGLVPISGRRLEDTYTMTRYLPICGKPRFKPFSYENTI